MDPSVETKNDTPAVEVTINKPGKVLHFCDGVDEEIEEVDTAELQNAPHPEPEVDPQSLNWGPWFSHYAWKSGTKVLNGIDYVGEGLASLFGITTPKYLIEIEEFKRIQEEKRKLDEESAGWVPQNGGGDVPLVMQEPVKDINKAIV